jgi:hypothetical protein
MEYTYWDVHFKRTKKNTVLFTNAIFQVNGRIYCTDTFGIDSGNTEEARYLHHCYVLVRVAIPKGKEEEFEQHSFGAGTLQEPPKVDIQVIGGVE